MSTRFYPRQTDYVVQLNAMDDDVQNAINKGDLAQKWSTQATGEVVIGQGYSAYYYAQQAAQSANSVAQAKDWATKAAGEVVAGQGYSAYYYAQLALAAATTANAAKNWATQAAGEVVVGQGYSAFYYATQAAASAATASAAKSWATQAAGEVVAGQGYSALYYATQAAASAATALTSKNWATQAAGEVVAGQGYSALYYASQAAASAATSLTSKNWATQATGEVVVGQGYSAYYYAQQALAAASAATSGQIQSNWDQSDNTQKDYIRNKPDLTLKADSAGNAAQNFSVKDLIASGVVTANGANYLYMKGQASGTAPSLIATGADTDVSLYFGTKGNGEYVFADGGGKSMARFGTVASAVNYLRFENSTDTNSPKFQVVGTSTNIGFDFTAKGSGEYVYRSNGGVQFVTGNTPNAVNYVRAIGNIAGQAAILETQGSDAAVGMSIRAKGSGGVFLSSGGVTSLVAAYTAAGVNYAQVSAGATTNGPSISALGTDANININLVPKGTGDVFVSTSVRVPQLDLRSSAPTVYFTETDQALPAGKWRIVADANAFRIDKNTAADGSFSTYVACWGIDASGVVGVPTAAVGTNTTQVASTAYVQSQKGAASGFAGLSASYGIQSKNAAGTVTSVMTNANTAARTYTFPDKDGTIATMADLTSAKGKLTYVKRTTSIILTAADIGSFFEFSGVFTQTFDTIANLGAGWYCYLHAANNAIVSMPSVDGSFNWYMYPGETRIIFVDTVLNRLRSVILEPFEYSTTSSGTFYLPPGYTYLDVTLIGGGAGGDGGGGGASGSSSGTYGQGGGGGAGGAGGAPGVVVRAKFPVVDLPTYGVSYTIGASGAGGQGGVGGAGRQTTSSTGVAGSTGTRGGSGGVSTFGDIFQTATYLTAAGGLAPTATLSNGGKAPTASTSPLSALTGPVARSNSAISFSAAYNGVFSFPSMDAANGGNGGGTTTRTTTYTVGGQGGLGGYGANSIFQGYVGGDGGPPNPADAAYVGAVAASGVDAPSGQPGCGGGGGGGGAGSHGCGATSALTGDGGYGGNGGYGGPGYLKIVGVVK